MRFNRILLLLGLTLFLFATNAFATKIHPSVDGPGGTISPSENFYVGRHDTATIRVTPANPYYAVNPLRLIDDNPTTADEFLAIDHWDSGDAVFFLPYQTRETWIVASFTPIPVAASFDFNPASGVGEATYAIQFTDTSSAGADSWNWNFGDGATSNLQNPSHTYAAAGTYQVTLTVANSQNGTSDTTEPITYTAIVPTITYQASVDLNTPYGTISPEGPMTLPEGTATTFTITSDQYYRVLDVLVDGVSNGAVTSLAYDGVTDKADHNIFVIFEPIPVVANFTTDLASGVGEATHPIQFTDASQEHATSWTWNFGDGTATTTEQNPAHTFAAAGTYTVTLTAKNDANGSVDTISVPYTAVAPTITYQASVDPTTPNGTISPAVGPWTVPEGMIMAYTFTANEYFKVADVLVDGVSQGAVTSLSFNGAVDWADHNIVVSFEPISVAVEFRTNPVGKYDYTTADQIVFVDVSQNTTNPLTTWTWFFGDGTTSAQQHPRHTFTDPGVYTVTLEVNNGLTIDSYEQIYTITSGTLAMPIVLSSSSAGYNNLQTAYDSAYDSGLGEETILLRADKTVNEMVNLYFDRDFTINLKGGYDNTFQSDSSFTRIDANVIISAGTVKVSKIIIGGAI